MECLNKVPSKIENEEHAEAIKETYRDVYEAISDLADVVDEPVLLKKLHLLDIGSWDEVVEERYLANLCGYPTCSNSIEKQNFTGRRFKIDRHEKKVYTAIPQYEKFCSTLCYGKSCHIQQQLYESPIWFNLERTPKEYSLELDPNRPFRRPEDIFVGEADKLLLTRLNEMKIADNVESSSENEDNDEAEYVEKHRHKNDDEAFVSEVRSFITSVANMTKKSNSNTMNVTSNPTVTSNNDTKSSTSNVAASPVNHQREPKHESKAEPKVDSPQPSNLGKLTEREMEVKLERLRQKYGQPERSPKKLAILIDPPQMDPEKASRLPADLR